MINPSQVFENELNQIKDKDIRKFMEYVLNKCPPYFFFVPSSSTGKYHPEQSNTVGTGSSTGGLVNHTKSVVYFAGILCRAFSVEGIAKDIVISSCLSHDCIKYGLPMQKYTTKTHSTDGANFVFNLAKQYISEGELLPLGIAKDICKGIAWHAGQWEVKPKKFPEEYSTTELIVHLADMVSAGREVYLGFLQENLIG